MLNSEFMSEKTKKAKDTFAIFVLTPTRGFMSGRVLAALNHGAQILCRYHNCLHFSVNHHSAALQVRLPRALARIESMAARIPDLLVLACKVTLSHSEVTS